MWIAPRLERLDSGSAERHLLRACPAVVGEAQGGTARTGGTRSERDIHGATGAGRNCCTASPAGDIEIALIAAANCGGAKVQRDAADIFQSNYPGIAGGSNRLVAEV